MSTEHPSKAAAAAAKAGPQAKPSIGGQQVDTSPVNTPSKVGRGADPLNGAKNILGRPMNLPPRIPEDPLKPFVRGSGQNALN